MSEAGGVSEFRQQQMLQYYYDHKERLIEQRRRWRGSHREEEAERSRSWRRTHPELVRRYRRAYYWARQLVNKLAPEYGLSDDVARELEPVVARMALTMDELDVEVLEEAVRSTIEDM